MGKKNKIFGNTLDYLVKRAEDELKKTNINLDSSTKSLKKKPITSRYVVKHIPPEIQEFVQFFTKNEVWNVEGIFRKNSSVKDLKKAKKIIEDEGSLNLDKYDKGDSILVSGLFKNFLAEIQGRIIPYKIYIKLKEAKTDADLKEVLKELPINNYETLNYINQFVLKINDHCETNYMNLSNLSIVIGPNLFELTNDEMVNLNITVISSDIYKNILRIRKTERDNAEGTSSIDQSNSDRNDNDSMIIKNLDSSLNVISELPQSCTSINDILNSPATVNLTRRNSKIKTIFIDHIKDKIQRRRSSISIPMIKNEKRKSDISNENERLKSDEYHGYEIFNSDDSHSMTKSEIVNKISKHNYEETNELYDDTLKRHFVENSDDSYNGSIHNQDSEFSPESTNMETINEESYDSLSASHQNLHKNNLEKISSKSKLNESTNLDEETHKCSDDNDNESLSSESSSISIDESTNSEEDDNKSAIEDENNKNDCVREQKTFNHKHLFEDSEVLLDNDNDNGSKMSHISSIEDTDSLIICNNNINDMKLMKSEYFDVIENDDERNDDESNCETIEIINYEKDENKHENEILNSNEIYYSINIPLNNEDIIQNNSKNNKKNKNEILKNYLTNEEIISKVSNTEKIELKRKKFSTVGPRSSIKIILDDEIESNLKDAMSTTNLNGENDPSEFLNKKLENNERNINVSEKSLSKIFKNDQNNVFESNMAFINQKFDSNIKDLNEDVKYYNSNYSIFYDKMENGKENMNNEFKEMENINESNEEFFDSNEDVKTDKNTNSNSEIVEKLFIPLKGGSESDETVDVNKIKNEMIEEKSDETNKHHNDVITTQHTEKELNNEMNEEERKYENVELSINKIDNSNHKRKPSKRNSKRVPRCISKSSAAVLSMLQFDLENVDVDKVNDNDLDNLISKTHKREESNLSDNCQDILNQKPTLMNLNTEFFSCEDNTFNNSGSNIKEKEPKLDVIDSQSNISLNKNNSSLQQTIPKSPAKPAPPPPSYNKIKTKSSSLVEVSITDIYENVEGNIEESENQIKTISEEIRERLEYKRKKNHLPDDINKMTYKEMLKEKKAIKQELVLLKSMYTNNHSNNSTSSQCNHNDFINNPLKNVVSSTLETNNSLNGKPPLNYDYNNNVISKKLQKDDIKFMKELYQKYAEIKFMIAKQNMEMDNDNEASSLGLEKLKQEKLALQIKLKNYQEEFVEKNGRPIKTLDDQKPIRQDYLRYKELKKILQQSS